MLKSRCVVLHTHRSDRKIIDRVLSKKTSRLPKRGISCLASGHPLHRLKFHLSAVCLSKFGMLTRGCRVGSSSCSLDKMPPVPMIAPASAAASFCGFSEVRWRLFVPTYHGSVRAPVFLHALTIVCVVIPSICTTFEICVQCFSEMMHRVLVCFTADLLS